MNLFSMARDTTFDSLGELDEIGRAPDNAP
jgi:hypothetical protein